MNIYVLEPFLSVAPPVFLLSLAIFALISKKMRSRNRLSKDFSAKCAVFIPCKGIYDEFENNIERFFNLSYHNYSIYFAVESENDAAVSVIRKKMDFYKKGTLVISERTKFCGQKNLNLVRAVEKCGKDAEILVFADSDIAPNSDWLDFLLSPLEDGKITAVSGFRWLYSKTNKFGGLVHSFQNYVLFVLFVMSAKLFNSGLWGGSMAIRKKDYDDLKVRDRWLETSVDDLSLAEILTKNKKKIEFCFDAVTDTSDTINSFSKASGWFVRQVQYLKYHQKISWIFAMLLSFVTLAFFIRVVTIIIFSFNAVPVCFLAGIYLFSAMFCLFGKKGKILPFIFWSPVSLIDVCACVIKTAFVGFIDWSGYRYYMNFRNGKVKKVEKI